MGQHDGIDKKKKIINTEIHQNFLYKLTRENNYGEHFYNDKDKISTVMFLHGLSSNGLVSFIHGSAVNNYMMGKKQNYSDIDIISTGDEKSFKAISTRFQGSADSMGMQHEVVFNDYVYLVTSKIVPGLLVDIKHYEIENNGGVLNPPKNLDSIDSRIRIYGVTIDLLLITDKFFESCVKNDDFQFKKKIVEAYRFFF